MEVLIGNVTLTLDMQERRGWGIENCVFSGSNSSELDQNFLNRLSDGIKKAKEEKDGYYKDPLGMSIIYDRDFLIRW